MSTRRYLCLAFTAGVLTGATVAGRITLVVVDDAVVVVVDWGLFLVAIGVTAVTFTAMLLPPNASFWDSPT